MQTGRTSTPCSRASLRFGADAQYTVGNTTALTLAGSAFSVANVDNSLGGRGFVAVDFASRAASGLNGTVEFGVSDNGGVDAKVALKVEF